MVEDQTHCPAGKSELTAKLYRDKLVVGVASKVVTGLDIPTDYIVVFSASKKLLSALDATLQVICAGIAEYSRQF